MPGKIKGILAKADDSYRLRYLLGKDDIDDIKTAVLVLKHRLVKEIPGLNISSFLDQIEIENLSENHFTSIAITLREEHLELKYNLYGDLELFNIIHDPDTELIEKVKQTITGLGFYKTGEVGTESENIEYRLETYKLNVVRRKV